jgi:MYXO-CTERM domain-containing protein
MASRLFPFVLLAVAAAVPARAADLFVQPYLQDPRPDGIQVLWETDAEAAGAVAYGTTPELGSIAPSPGGQTRHEVTLSGLEPNTLYHYQVQVDGQPAGTPGTFTTAPATPVPFSFLVYGDTRSDAVAHAQIVSRMLEHPASFVINTGDLVSSGDVVAQWEEFFDIVSVMARDMVLFPAVGNHDEVGKQLPPSWWRFFRPPAAHAAHPSYYAWTWSNARFLVLDMYVATTIDVDCLYRIGAFEDCLDADQTDWLEVQLAEAELDPAVDHVFVFVHIGPYSSKPGRTGSAEIRSLLGRFLGSKVKAVFSGHDHYYEHGQAGNRLHYVISGGGGAPLYETQPADTLAAYPRDVKVSTSVYNFQVVRVDGAVIEVSTHEADGSLLERFTIDDRPECATADDCALAEPGFCEGSWSCDNLSRCAWVCKPPPECETALDCGDPPTDACQGGWDCIDRYCEWQCDALPECTTADDCAERTPPVACPNGGTWACPLQTCEWSCNAAPPDPGSQPDAAIVDPGPTPEDVPVAVDPGPKPGTKSGGGCTAGDAGDATGAWLAGLALAVAWLLRRRGVAQRAES